MKIQKVIEYLEQLAPKYLAESWDNVGLLVGDEQADTTGILFTLDVTEATLDEAIRYGANLIISHHPPLFRGIQTIVATQPQQALFMKAIRHGISLYAAHTNMDVAQGGMNDWLAQALGLENLQILHIDGTLEDGTAYGIGRVGTLPQEIVLSSFLDHVDKSLYTHGIRYVGDLSKTVKKIAILGGAGQGYYTDAIAHQADVLITGDTTYHVAQEMQDRQLVLIDPGHFVEFIFIEKMMEYYETFAKKHQLTLFASTHNSDPYQFKL